ncbi:MAG: AAC(3) family N-acetyltransferase [bacterium]
MSELDATTKGLVTQLDLESQLDTLGLHEGMTVLVHTRMSALGWVCGGAQAVVDALLNVLGVSGTLMVPTFSSHLSDPSGWESPPVPKAWWSTIRATLPAYDPSLTPTRGMGVVADTLRAHPRALRSSHPAVSFAAVGAHAAALTQRHELSYGLGEGSPLARLYELDGHVLLLGVGHANNSSIHLAEYRTQNAHTRHYRAGAPMMVGLERQWVAYDDIDNDPSDFTRIGRSFEKAHPPNEGLVGAGRARLFRQVPLVDHATSWMDRHRPVEP